MHASDLFRQLTLILIVKDGKQDEHQLTNPKDKNFSLYCSAKMLQLPPIILAREVVVRVITRSQSFDCFV